MSFPNQAISSESSNNQDAILALGKSLGAFCIREVKFCTSTFYALECPGYLGIGGKIWDSTYVLLAYLSRLENIDIIRHRNILELGSGTGIAGIALSKLCPASVTLSDLPEISPLISENIDLNKSLQSDIDSRLRLSETYFSKSYRWGDPLHTINSPVQSFDVIIASDIVYDPIGYEPLYQTLRMLLGIDGESKCIAADCHRFCILAHRHRNPEDKRFVEYTIISLTVTNVELMFFSHFEYQLF
jgi:predicted nicotinamide N-methyase